MKKGGFLRNVLDTIRSNQATSQSGRGGSGGSGSDRANEFGGQLKPSHFSLSQVARHGFPEHPTALAFDPVQKIAAIGTKSGALRIFGRPGVDVWAQHEPAFAITYIRFIVNQGAIITVTSDDSIHLWSLRGPNLKLQLSSTGQGVASSSSPSTAGGAAGAGGGISPAPTASSNLSCMSPQSGMSTNTSGLGGGGGISSTSNSLLDKVTDTVSGAVDSASDFLSGGGGGGSTSSDLTASPTGAASEPKQIGSRKPEILHTLKFQREHITCLHQTLMSKWLYIGTERGNVHVANVETFELSGYSIAWNKAIELSRKTHPGAIIHISECPQDTNKLLIGYESGCIVLWDLKQRNADGRYYQAENLLWLAWHYEGKQFVAAHGDGSLITWQTRSNAKPASILYPHAKTSAPGALDVHGDSGPAINQLKPQQSLSLAHPFNNELYRPINKVIWNTSKSSNEQFILFSGGLPYDGFNDASHTPQEPHTSQQHSLSVMSTSPPPSRQSVGPTPVRLGASSSHQQLLKTGSPGSPSPMSPSLSHQTQQQQQQPQQHHPKVLRSTSLTVMLGKSIAVLEMDDIIVDFVTICENSPYENDASDPYAVIVLLSNELILIDLTSSGYPSFDSPYPSASLNESPVTCIQYLADCSSDLIPFLYSTSQHVISRAPKKGFSDKEWPINGGEWGQSLQSYPELVLTGHADGTIKFWDMSGINFDLISKIKTSKLFERPNKPPNAIFIASNQGTSPLGTANANLSAANLGRAASNCPQNVPQGSISPNRSGATSNLGGEQQHSNAGDHHYYNSQTATSSTMPNAPIDNITQLENSSAAIEANIFAIERIEFCPTTRHLLVAGAFSQIIQFKLNKKDSAHSTSGGGAPSELTTILVEPTGLAGAASNSQLSAINEQVASNNLASLVGRGTSKQHLIFRVKDHQQAAGAAGGSSSGGSSSSSGSHKVRLSGFQPELICLTPLLVSTIAATTNTNHELAASSNVDGAATSSSGPASLVYCCQVPPKITALALQETHNILGYAHENGVVLVDIVQKCVIMNAALSDLYGGISVNNRDISIQPFATSSILQHHYQSTCSPASPTGANTIGSSSEYGYNNNNKHVSEGATQRPADPGKTDNDASNDPAESDTSTIFNKLTASNGQSKRASSPLSTSPASQPANNSSISSNSNQIAGLTRQATGAAFDLVGSVTLNSQLSVQPNNQLSSSTSFNQLQDHLHQHSQVSRKTTSTKPQCPTQTGLQVNIVQAKQQHQQSQQPPAHQQAQPSLSTFHSNATTGGPTAKPSTSVASSGARPSSSSPSAAVCSSQQGQPIQSRYTTNSMFQRQLSTNALNASSSNKVGPNNANNNLNGAMSGGPATSASTATSTTSGAKSSAPRLFQRQMTASQLSGGTGSGSGSSASGGQMLDSKQSAAALLASVRADPSLTSSAVCLAGSNFTNNNGQHQQPQLLATTGGSARLGRTPEVNNEQTGKKVAKNKRIISRMLSISAIHTTVGGSAGGGPSSGGDSSQDDAMQLNESTSGGAAGGFNSASSAFNQVGNNTSGAADKFDSSFARSRSSSTSSTTPLNETHLANPTNNNNNSAATSESIQCIAFLDPLAGSSGTSGGASSGPSSGPNHKSLCSNDAQSPVSGQLALWLGTSTGSVLLVNLTMPDNEDNRVLQLQSINAEPIPQASVKLPGQILQIMPFTCEARPSSQSSGGGGNASQSSSIEGDTFPMQSPGPSSGSTGGASGASQATSSGLAASSASQLSAHDHHSSGKSSFESRTGMFLLLVSEKQARVYQVPASWSQPAPAPTTDHHHHQQHHQQKTQHSSTDPPMGRLLINNSNLFAKCDLSDTSYACRSSHVQMRTPDESCLVSYLATGNIVVHALPKLRPILMEADFVAYTSPRIGQSMRFSRQGHCLYQPSAGEIAKFTVSSQYKALVNEMTGALYVAREMPEMPRANFFKSLFSVSQSARQSDRDELFAESGKPSRSVAKHVGSSSSTGGGGLDKLKGAAVGTMGHDMRVAREGLDERGERLGQIEDQTLNMLNSSESYAQAAHQLAQKFKDKKWYQF